MSPISVGKIAGASVVAAAVVGIGTGVTVSQLFPAPDRGDFAITTPELTTTHQVQPKIHNSDGVLSGSDVDRLHTDAERLEVPKVVTQLHYIVFAENDDNINDTVQNYLRDEHPELLDGDYFADGVLIVGVGLDPRQSFVYAGNDVADGLDLRESNHLDNSVDAIKPGVKDNNIPAGLFHGATVAIDLEEMEKSQHDSSSSAHTAVNVGSGVVGAAIGGITVGSIGAVRRSRQQKIARAREGLDLVMTNYSDMAHRLDSVDIRAHSLSSPLVNAQLRSQWDQVRTDFLDVHDTVDQLGGLQQSAPDEQFLEHAEDIEQAQEATERAGIAEDNINQLFDMEQGDATTRQAELEHIRSDARDAMLELDDSTSALHAELDQVRRACETIDPQSENFMEEFARLQSDYQAVLKAIDEQRVDDIDRSSSTELTAPALWEKDWHPGYGVNNFVPFWALSTWHSSNLQAQQAADNSSSGTNTSFSSGFSGAGGSSSF